MNEQEELAQLRAVLASVEMLAQKLATVPEHRSMSARICEAVELGRVGGADD